MEKILMWMNIIGTWIKMTSAFPVIYVAGKGAHYMAV